MPHQCTTCGNVFADGSKEMLGGCPDCGNNTFQFHAGEVPEDAGVPEESVEAPPDPPEEPSRVARAADTVRDFVASDTEPEWPDWPGESEPTPPGDGESDDADIIDSSAEPGVEDRAQADARTEFADAGEFAGDAEGGSEGVAEDGADAGDGGPVKAGDTPDDDSDVVSAPGGSGEPPDPERGRVVSEPAESGEETDLATLRAELDEQFESIRIVEPGQYELNLMELYDRQEYIIALQEDGRYVIEVPDSWEEPDGGN